MVATCDDVKSLCKFPHSSIRLRPTQREVTPLAWRQQQIGYYNEKIKKLYAYKLPRIM